MRRNGCKAFWATCRAVLKPTLMLLLQGAGYNVAQNIDILKGVQDLRASDVDFVCISLLSQIPI